MKLRAYPTLGDCRFAHYELIRLSSAMGKETDGVSHKLVRVDTNAWQDTPKTRK